MTHLSIRAGRNRGRAMVGLVLSWSIFILCLFGCNPDVNDGVGPRLLLLNVKGVALRDGDHAKELSVILRVPDPDEGEVVVATTVTDDDGEFEFSEVEAGHWEVKVSGDEVGDFHSVTREFILEDAAGSLELPPMEVWGYGADIIEPTDGTIVPPPTTVDPLAFRWRLPDREVESVRVQLYDRDSWIPVWVSDKILEEEALWDGIGNQGDFDGVPILGGVYSWRIKIRFPDGLEARFDRQRIFWQEQTSG